jgi:hypothetical protein
MTGFCFAETTTDGITLWLGNPSCQAAHDDLLAELGNHTSTWLPASEPLNPRLAGNLGEFITFFIGNELATNHATSPRQTRLRQYRTSRNLTSIFSGCTFQKGDPKKTMQWFRRSKLHTHRTWDMLVSSFGTMPNCSELSPV